MEEKYGSPWLLCHRADLHNELKLLATQQYGDGKPVEVRLCAIVDTIVRICLTPISLPPVTCCPGPLSRGVHVAES